MTSLAVSGFSSSQRLEQPDRVRDQPAFPGAVGPAALQQMGARPLQRLRGEGDEIDVDVQLAAGERRRRVLREQDLVVGGVEGQPRPLEREQHPHVVEEAVVGGVGLAGEVRIRLDGLVGDHLVEAVGHQRHRHMAHGHAGRHGDDRGVHRGHHAVDGSAGEARIARGDVLDDLDLDVDALGHPLFLDDEPRSVDRDRDHRHDEFLLRLGGGWRELREQYGGGDRRGCGGLPNGAMPFHAFLHQVTSEAARSAAPVIAGFPPASKRRAAPRLRRSLDASAASPSSGSDAPP